MKKILVTGGAGYIGSHTTVELIEHGFEPILFDNFSNSSPKVLDRIASICGRRPTLVEGDIRDGGALESVFVEHDIDAVIHFAGLKAVGESVEQPLRYYENNVTGSLRLFQAMQKAGCQRLVFSSSATVYGDPVSVPIAESFPLTAANPYGQSKLIIENILRDLAAANSELAISILRYFNPVAAHPSGEIGEDPNGIPNNLMPFIAQVGVGKLKQLSVYGNDYATADGTGVRDYIHVCDLASAHVQALNALNSKSGCREYNIGTGKGYSVMEMISAFERASEVKVPFKVVPRRPGDVASCYADPEKANNELNWSAKYQLDEMMRDQWNWQSRNPEGYQ